MTKRRLVGIDTPFLLAHGLLEHPDHREARKVEREFLDDGAVFCICETVLAEFIHVVTDARRFEKPSSMEQALRLTGIWLHSRETTLISPTQESIALALAWLQRYRLGRKRILDTMIAATYHSGGVETILTTNARDSRIFGCFTILDFTEHA